MSDFYLNLDFIERFFEKYSNIKFHEDLPSGSRVVPCGRTDRHDEANSRFSQFWKSALKKAIFLSKMFKDISACPTFYAVAQAYNVSNFS